MKQNRHYLNAFLALSCLWTESLTYLASLTYRVA